MKSKKIKTTFECIRVIRSRIFFDNVDSEFAAALKNKSEETVINKQKKLSNANK